ncbi:MAG TPA: hypothetical protein VFW33_07845 [Gemmataceae bacterium]|nr:hypothetical protein [Gemmataceae bacterium]
MSDQKRADDLCARLMGRKKLEEPADDGTAAAARLFRQDSAETNAKRPLKYPTDAQRGTPYVRTPKPARGAVNRSRACQPGKQTPATDYHS